MNTRLRKKKADFTIGMSRKALKSKIKFMDELGTFYISIIEKQRKAFEEQRGMNEDLINAHYLDHAEQEKEIVKLTDRNKLLAATLQDAVMYNSELERENKVLQAKVFKLSERNLLQRILNKGANDND
ncbi:MAG: hypothetical protein RR817_11235 [Niameybacter sp.]